MVKVKMRRGVFETNSSNTHSVQLVGGGEVDRVTEEVMYEIMALYSERLCCGRRSESDYLDEYTYPRDGGGTEFVLCGFRVEESEERSCVAYVVGSWVMRLQFLGMMVRGVVGDDCGNPLVRRLCELCLGYIKGKGLSVDDVVFGDSTDYSVSWCWDYELDEVTICDVFAKVMADGYVVKYTDYAYSPCDPPKVVVY